MKSLKILAFVLLTLILARPCWAERAYVIDSFEITFRTGPSTENKILSMLSSGQPLEVLSSDEKWSHVRVVDTGKEGWVLTRYLTTRLPWETQAKALQKEVTFTRNKLASTEKELKDTLNENHRLATTLEKKTRDFDELNRTHNELKAGVGEYLTLKEKFSSNEAKLKTAETKLQALESENQKLRSEQRHKWIVAGALVLLFGLLLGLFMGSRNKRRRSTYL